MAAHQRDAVRTQAFREVAALFDVVTRRLVSPKLSAMSQTGTSDPIKLPAWITGRSFVAAAMLKGRVSSAWAWTTAMTSGRASRSRRG